MPQKPATARILGFPRVLEDDVRDATKVGDGWLVRSVDPAESVVGVPERNGDPSSMTYERNEPGGKAAGAGTRGLSRKEFRRLYIEECSKILGFFRRRGVEEEQAKELVSEVFMKAWQNRGKFRGESTELSWLFGVADKTLRKSRRYHGAEKRRPSKEAMAALADIYGGQGGPRAGAALEELLTEERRRLLIEGIQSLKGPQQACLRLLIFQARSYKEIATILGLRVSQVSSHIRLGKKNLEKLLRG